jgi:tetratricopeptide (TPR) repeat protein
MDHLQVRLKDFLMQRSILILCLSLSLIVVLTVMLFQDAPRVDENAAVDMRQTRMSLNPRGYRVDLDAPTAGPTGTELSDLLESGYAAWRRGDLARAEDIFRTALLWDDRNADTVRSIGQLAFLDQRYTEAINYFTLYRRLAANEVDAYTNLAIAFICAERFVESEATVEAGLKRCPQKPGPFHFLLACIAEKQGRVDAADAYITEAHAALGEDLFKLVNSHWSASLRDLPAYRGIVADGPARAETAQLP